MRLGDGRHKEVCMNKNLKTIVSLVVGTALCAGVGCGRGEACDMPAEPEQHTHEREPGPVQELRPIVFAVASGKEMSGSGPLIIMRRQKAPL